MAKKEPEELRRGKAFHKEIQAEWESDAEGIVYRERTVLVRGGWKGRVDVFVDTDEPDGVIAIVEIKASDWDKMADKAVRRNARRQINQVWKYIESQIKDGKMVATGEGKGVSPGIIFPKRPADKKRMKLIEEMFEEEGIPVVWHDESIEEARKRSQGNEDDVEE